MVQTKWILAFHLHVLKDEHDKLEIDDFTLNTPELDDSDLYSTLTFSSSELSSEKNKSPREKKIAVERRFNTQVERTKNKL